ncbi:MAG: phospholipase A2 [Deinococcus sp.]|nr:phospholipase A2 [Deinococcus sp.]
MRPGLLRRAGAFTLLAGTLSATLSACVPAVQPQTPSAALLARADAAVPLVKTLGWGTPEAFALTRPALEPLWPELDWTSNGCSAPRGLGLGYRAEFTPACTVHDFAYHNLRVLEPTAANRQASDEAFRRNLWAICGRKAAAAQPGCFAAAAAYAAAVRLRGSGRFAPGT